MASSMHCPGCNALVAVDESHKNKTLRCASCKTLFQVPREQISKEDETTAAPAEKKESATGIKVKKGPSRPPELPKSESKGPPRRRLEKERKRKSDEGSSIGGYALIGAVVGVLVLCLLSFGGIGVWVALPSKPAPPDPIAQGPMPIVEQPPPIVGFPPIENPKDPLPPPIIETKKEEKIFPDPIRPKDPDPIRPKDPPPPVKSPLPAANVSPLKITPAPASFDKATLNLPGTLGRVCLGGGGRFLIATVPGQRQIAVLDVNERKIVKYLPAAGDQPLIAAGLEKLVVAYPQQNLIQRWNLLTFEKEVTVNSPFQGTIRALCMGHASFGPILVAAQGERFGGGMQFLSLDNFKTFNPEAKPNQNFGDGHFLHASANGRFFGMRNGVGGEPHTVTLISLTDNGLKPSKAGAGGSVPRRRTSVHRRPAASSVPG